MLEFFSQIEQKIAAIIGNELVHFCQYLNYVYLVLKIDNILSIFDKSAFIGIIILFSFAKEFLHEKLKIKFSIPFSINRPTT